MCITKIFQTPSDPFLVYSDPHRTPLSTKQYALTHKVHVHTFHYFCEESTQTIKILCLMTDHRNPKV